MITERIGFDIEVFLKMFRKSSLNSTTFYYNSVIKFD